MQCDRANNHQSRRHALDIFSEHALSLYASAQVNQAMPVDTSMSPCWDQCRPSACHNLQRRQMALAKLFVSMRCAFVLDLFYPNDKNGVGIMRSSILVALFVTALGSSSWADIIPPNVSNCNSKNAGDTCQTEDGSDGSCVLVKNGYCRFHPDHGSTCVDILKCVKNDQGAASINAANFNGDEDALSNEGCSNVGNNGGVVSFASIGIGMFVLLFVRSLRRKGA